MGDQFEIRFIKKLKGIDVFHSNEMVNSFGFKGGAGGPLKIAGKIFPRQSVVVDDWFMKQKPHVQDFVLFHEIGHIKHHDPWKIKRMFKNHKQSLIARNNLDPRMLSLEFSADKYAAQHIGTKQTISALKKLKRSLPLFCRFGSSGKELNLRIKRLK